MVVTEPIATRPLPADKGVHARSGLWRISPPAVAVVIVYFLIGLLRSGRNSHLASSLGRWGGLRPVPVVPRLAASFACPRPQSVVQQCHVGADRSEPGPEHGKSVARIDHRSLRSRLRRGGEGELAAVAGHAHLGDGRVRRTAKVAGMGCGGRAGWTDLWILALHGGSKRGPRKPGVRTIATIHRADNRLRSCSAGVRPNGSESSSASSWRPSSLSRRWSSPASSPSRSQLWPSWRSINRSKCQMRYGPCGVP